MPDAPVSVEGAVEKMLGEKPLAEDRTPPETPVSTTPGKEGQPTGETTPKAGEESTGELTAFEQELIDELDEEDRKAFEEGTPEARQQTLAFMKKQYRKNAKQMTELGTLRKAVGALREAGVSNEDLVELVQRKRGVSKLEAQRVVDATQQAAGKRGYQRWLDQSKTPEERESLREAEQVIREVVEDVVSGLLAKAVKPLRDRLDFSDREMRNQRAQGLEQEINALEDELGYPGSLVETYRQQMLQLGLREPKLSAEDLLVRAAGFATVKAAMLKMQPKAEGGNGKPPLKPSLGRPAPVISKPGQSTGELPRRKGGGISITKALDLLMRPKQ